MKLIQKGNKQLRVDDVRAEAMLKAGFVEVDEKTGKPILTAEAKAENDMKKENADLKKENEALKAQVAKLTAKLEELSAPRK